MIFAIIGSLVFSGIIVLYISLALGLPYGEFAMGGKYKIMPREMRFVCAFSVVIQIIAVVIILQTAGIIPLFLSASVTRGICYFFSVYLSFNVIINIISKSKKEKVVMTPLSLVTAICFWVTAIRG